MVTGVERDDDRELFSEFSTGRIRRRMVFIASSIRPLLFPNFEAQLKLTNYRSPDTPESREEIIDADT